MKKKFNNINSTLSKLLDQYNLTHIYSLETIKKGWFQMDKTIAAHSDPIEYNPGLKVLKIKVHNSTWRKEFKENKELLLTRAKNYFSTIEIKNIELI